MEPLARESFASVKRSALARLPVQGTTAHAVTGAHSGPTTTWPPRGGWSPRVEHLKTRPTRSKPAEESHFGFDLARLVIAVVGLGVQLAVVGGLLAGAAWLLIR